MFNRRLYHETIRELHAPQDKVEEIIAMTEQTNPKKHFRSIRTVAVAAAAIAMLSIGVSAANLEGVQEFFYHISSVVKVDAFRTNISTQEGDQIAVLDLSQVFVEKRDSQVFLIAGEEELDITQALEQDGRYEYRNAGADTQVTAVVTGTPEEYTLDLSITTDDEDSVLYSYSTDSNGEVLQALEGDLNAVVSAYTSEDGRSAQVLP